jgi:HCOMODA/2-hydroxy-3-carboxy-muconic semialdehyde decarboxylase
MSRGDDDLRNDIVAAARAFSRLHYVHAFGHISARIEKSVLITPTRPPLAAQCGSDLLELDLDGGVVKGDPAARPIEVFLHIGIYKQRAQVAAICRTHAPFASTWPENAHEPSIQHGFGGIAGNVAYYDGFDLVHDANLGTSAAMHLGSADALILRGNGVLTVGRTLGEASARMWALEELCVQAHRQGGRQINFSAGELAARARWYPAEAERIWSWLKYLGGNDSARDARGS